MSDQELLDLAKEFAKALADIAGIGVPPSGDWANSRYPRHQRIWNIVCTGFEVLLRTDLDDVLTNLEEPPRIKTRRLRTRATENEE